jgi:MFS family permease
VLLLIPAVYFVFVAAEFATMTQLALGATAAGRSALAVGLLGTALWGGILVASTRAAGAVARFGHARVFVGATAVALLAVGGLNAATAFAAQLAGATTLGLAGGLVWVAGEAWLAEAAPPDRRGFYVGLFETAVGLGLMTGPALVPLARALGWPVAALAVPLMALALLASLALLRQRSPASPVAVTAADGAAAAADWRGVARPVVAVAVCSGLMEAGVSSLLPSVSMRLGYTLEAAAWLGTVIGAGSALLQPPAGHLADRWGVRRSTTLAWCIVLATTLVLLARADAPGALLWAVGFTLGGVGGAVYTLLIVDLGHRLAGADLVRAIGLLVIGYAAGTAVGPTLGGAAFDAFGLRGLAAMLLLMALLGLVLTWRQGRVRGA